MTLRLMILLISALTLLSLKVQGYTDQPEGCWLKPSDGSSCAIRASKSEWVMTRDDQKIFLGSGATVIRSAEGLGKLRLVSGSIWIESESEIKLENLGYEFTVQGESWWVKTEGRVAVQVFSGFARTPFQSAQDTVLAGFENWWELGSRGVAKPFVAEKTLRDWNRWILLPKDKVTAKIQSYRKNWKDRIEISSNFYQEVVDRRLATAESRERRAEERMKNQARERQKIRQMFRDRFANP